MNMDFFVAAPCMGGRGKRVVALSPLTVLLFAVQTHDVLYRVLESPATRHITLFLNHHLTGWFPLPFWERWRGFLLSASILSPSGSTCFGARRVFSSLGLSLNRLRACVRERQARYSRQGSENLPGRDFHRGSQPLRCWLDEHLLSSGMR
ncbi:MAG: hypothetical protein RLZZ117_1737 [Cyanobacteriota bacterium]|jgi:hypothetical protein